MIYTQYQIKYCIGVNTEFHAKIVFALKFFTTLDDNNKESSFCSKQHYAAVNLELTKKKKNYAQH